MERKSSAGFAPLRRGCAFGAPHLGGSAHLARHYMVCSRSTLPKGIENLRQVCYNGKQRTEMLLPSARPPALLNLLKSPCVLLSDLGTPRWVDDRQESSQEIGINHRGHGP